MIRVEKDYGQVPDGLSGAGAERKRAEALRDGVRHQAAGYYYAHDSVKEKLLEIYRNKCAYCESPKNPGWAWQVDHYRPNKPRESGDTHSGYYWLAYEWSNLLLSCETCNIKKSNRFPISGTRVEAPQTDRKEWLANSESLIAEEPLLLNPELDHPEKHFVFFPDGAIEDKGGSEHGKKTIEVCDLEREELRLARKAVVDSFRKNIWKQFTILYNGLQSGRLQERDRFRAALKLAFNTLFEDIVNSRKPGHKFSRLGWHMANEFRVFFVDNLPAGQPQDIIAFAFELFRTE